MSRVRIAIEKMEDRLAKVPADKLHTVDLAARLDFEEYCKFQELKSLAVSEGKMSLEEGMTVYGLLGNTSEHFNSQKLAARVVLVQLFSELLRVK